MNDRDIAPEGEDSSEIEQARIRRHRAEEQYAEQPELSQEALSLEEGRNLVHELGVHQIELEMQNEELRRAQEELEASRARFIDLYDLAPIGYCTLSQDSVILESNLKAAAMLGETRSNLLKKPITRFIYQDDQDIYYLHRRALFETGEPKTCELRLLKAGTPFWARLEAILLQDRDGAPVCRVVLSDITERRKAEAERELLQTQLYQAQRIESIGRLAGGVAHDFNNMLGVILGYAELGLLSVDPEDQLHDDLEQIQKAAQRSANLTRQLLAFARHQIAEPRTIDLNETIERMLKMLRSLIGEQIRLVWLPGKDLWLIKMDPSQIDQIITNLCLNARDAIAGFGEIIIKTGTTVRESAHGTPQAEATSGEYVVLSVSDNGSGMDAHVMEHLFEPFFTTKDVGKGTGLGLATVYGIVKQNMGHIEVTSTLGQGTTFEIYLPRHINALALEQDAVELAPIVQGGETILLVEDEPAILRIVSVMLSHQGYTVLSAALPHEAILVAEEHAGEIDLLITDVIMPEMNGRDLADRLMQLFPKMVCLFMSGYTADVIAKQGLVDEGTWFIQKPFSMSSLAAKVRDLLDQTGEGG